MGSGKETETGVMCRSLAAWMVWVGVGGGWWVEGEREGVDVSGLLSQSRQGVCEGQSERTAPARPDAGADSTKLRMTKMEGMRKTDNQRPN